MYALEIHPSTSPPPGHSLVNNQLRKMIKPKKVMIKALIMKNQFFARKTFLILVIIIFEFTDQQAETE
jgi:hypothetical protein